MVVLEERRNGTNDVGRNPGEDRGRNREARVGRHRVPGLRGLFGALTKTSDATPMRGHGTGIANVNRPVRAVVATVVALFLLSTAVLLFAATARAEPSPTPNGYCGALNMAQDPTMATIPMVNDAPQGNAGMFTAVAASDCS